MLHTLLTVVQVICCAAIIFLVLIQRGKGAEAGAGFGAGASGTVFGARGASTALSRATAIFAAIFMINSLLLTYLGSKASTEQPKTLLDEAAPVQHAAPHSPGSGSPGTPSAGGTSGQTNGPSSAPASAPANAATAPAAATPSQAPPSAAPATPAGPGK